MFLNDYILNMQRINVSELLGKLKTKEDRVNFMREAGNSSI